MDMTLVKIKYHPETKNANAWYELEFVNGHNLIRQYIYEEEYIEKEWIINTVYAGTLITPNK